MKTQLLTSLLAFGLAAVSAAYPIHLNQYAQGYKTESHPNDDTNIKNEGANLGFIKNGTWVHYENFDFFDGVNRFYVEAGAPATGGGTIELRVDDVNTGPVIGTVNITSTGAYGNYQPFHCPINLAGFGKKQLFLKFSGTGTGNLFNLRNFRFDALESGATGEFDLEVAPTNQNIIRKVNSEVHFITNNSWVAFTDYVFPQGANQFEIEAASFTPGGTIQVRTGSATGPILGSVAVPNTGSWSAYQTFTFGLSSVPVGPVNLYLTFIRTSGTHNTLMNTRRFRAVNTADTAPNLRTVSRVITASSFNEESHPGDNSKIATSGFRIGSISDGTWVKYTNVDFGTGCNSFQVEAASATKGGKVELWLGSPNGTPLGHIDVTHTGSWTFYRPFNSAGLTSTVSGVQTLCLKFVNTNGQSNSMMDIRSISFWNTPVTQPPPSNGTLNVYPPVPGLAPSPYYRIYVQKKSLLNNADAALATNWLEVFPWFTQCVDYPGTPALHDASNYSAYYSRYIGGWSHTYCNFEMDPDTPIIIKIVRRSDITDGAPSGPINDVAVRPVSSRTSFLCSGGAVYIEMNRPANLAVDIDKRLDNRNTPRQIPAGWGDAADPATLSPAQLASHPFPHRFKAQGAHSVSIFANPVIPDKPPASGGADVYYVEPGTLPPATGTFKTLYFKPGIHKFSVTASGAERPWELTDIYKPQDDKSYYIPGDAIVYGNFNDGDDGVVSKNIRIFGHGTISGAKIPHAFDFTSSNPALLQMNPSKGKNMLHPDYHKQLRMLLLTHAQGCTFEGVTVADPAHHGIYMNGSTQVSEPNMIKWVKNISWRTNNDSVSATENSFIEDCFFRHQDDGVYVNTMAIRRCVFWSDVNGMPLRCSFIHNNRGASFPTIYNQDIVVEDCEVVYCRGVFADSDSTAHCIIGTPGVFGSTKYYGDGTPNMGQHIWIRNLTISDPKPVRYLLGFHADAPSDPTHVTPWAGLRLQNIDYQNPQVWGWKNRLKGTTSATIKFWMLDNVQVRFEGTKTKLTAADLTNPDRFETSNVSNMIFK